MIKSRLAAQASTILYSKDSIFNAAQGEIDFDTDTVRFLAAAGVPCVRVPRAVYVRSSIVALLKHASSSLSNQSSAPENGASLPSNRQSHGISALSAKAAKQLVKGRQEKADNGEHNSTMLYKGGGVYLNGEKVAASDADVARSERDFVCVPRGSSGSEGDDSRCVFLRLGKKRMLVVMITEDGDGGDGGGTL